MDRDGSIMIIDIQVAKWLRSVVLKTRTNGHRHLTIRRTRSVVDRAILKT